jgi:hypothetical protein
MNDLPTPRTTLRAGFTIRVWCKAGCVRRVDVDPQAIIDAGRGDVPLIHLRYRCSKCGSRRTDWVVASKRTGPWNVTPPHIQSATRS